MLFCVFVCLTFHRLVHSFALNVQIYVSFTFEVTSKLTFHRLVHSFALNVQICVSFTFEVTPKA